MERPDVLGLDEWLASPSSPDIVRTQKPGDTFQKVTPPHQSSLYQPHGFKPSALSLWWDEWRLSKTAYLTHTSTLH